MNKKGMSVFSLIFLMTALTVGYAVTVIDADIDTITNITVWPGVNISDTGLHPEIELALDEYINGLGSAYFALTRWVEEYAYNNPQVPYKLLLYGLFIALAMPIIVGLIKIFVIIGILINELIHHRREKKKTPEKEVDEEDE